MIPADPVPTCGGNTLIIPVGVKDQREVEARQDVLVYTGAPAGKTIGSDRSDQSRALCLLVRARYGLYRETG